MPPKLKQNNFQKQKLDPMEYEDVQSVDLVEVIPIDAASD